MKHQIGHKRNKFFCLALRKILVRVDSNQIQIEIRVLDAAIKYLPAACKRVADCIRSYCKRLSNILSSKWL